MRGGRLALIALLGAGIVVSSAASAQAAESIGSFIVLIQVRADGLIDVTETIAYDFGADPHHGILRDIESRARFDATYDRVTPISEVSVTSPDAPADLKISERPEGITRVSSRVIWPTRSCSG